VTLSPDEAASAIESVLLVADRPLSIRNLARLLALSESIVRQALQHIQKSFDGHGIRLQAHQDHVQLVTAPENAAVVRRFLNLSRKSRLSRPALETLAIVAYRQPVTRSEIEQIRGVNSDRIVASLLARGLIEERGHRTAPGRPIEYGTSFAFLEFFGLASLAELPTLDEITGPMVGADKLGFRSHR
jgi:segregation and condensation protein B